MGTGNSQQQSLFSSLEFLIKENVDFSHPLWRKLSKEFQSRRNCSSSLARMKNQRGRRIPMKRRVRLDRPVRPINAMERKVRILQRLIPNSETMRVERLLRATADYIVALQMRVKVLQIMVNASTGSDDQ